MRALVPGAAVGLTLALLLPAVPARADLEHFRRSLAALKRLEKAPAGSIEALGELVRRTQP